MFALRTLGRAEVCGMAGCVSVASWNDRQAGRRALCLVLGRLAVDGGRWIARDQLIDAAWTENEYGSAEAGFYAVMRRLRRALRDSWPVRRPWIECDDGLYRLARDSRLSIDCEEVPRLIQKAHRLDNPEDAAPHWDRVLSLYGGEFLAEVNGEDPWVLAHRARLEELRLVAVLGLARCQLETGHQAAAREVLWSTLAQHGDDERLHEALVHSYSAAGLAGPARRAKREIERIVDHLHTDI